MQARVCWTIAVQGCRILIDPLTVGYMRNFRRTLCVGLLLPLIASSSMADRLRLAWPTKNKAYAEGRPLEDYIQPTVSGRVESGLFGCVRTEGWQFHEALDLKSVERDRRGEPTDEVFAVMGGVVRHVSDHPGKSSYGRYIVIEHVDAALPVSTLYAHLASIASGVRPGSKIEIGTSIGVMGRSAGSQALPKARAHLHFEIGLRLTDKFQSWYGWKEFGSKNDHDLWNGMNLVGVDPKAFYDAFRDQRVDTFLEFWQSKSAAVTVRIATRSIPDFIRRYPALRSPPMPLFGLAGWDVDFDEFGVPIAWRPLLAEAVQGYKGSELRIIATDEELLGGVKCKDLVKTYRGKQIPDDDLQTNLQLLFGLHR